MPGLALSLLGPFVGSVNGRPLQSFRSNRSQALLMYLATEFALGATFHQRESLMALLWPGLPLKSAQVNLRQALYQLRQAIPASSSLQSVSSAPPGADEVDFLLTDRRTVRVNPEYPLELDVAQFVQDLSGHQRLWSKAVVLYRGDFLADFYLPDANAFEEWATARRASFQRQMLDALANLAEVKIEEGRYQEAEGYARRQLELDPLREKGHRQLMTLLARDGRRGEALAQYEACRQLLEKELGVEPSARTRALQAAILAGQEETERVEPSFNSGYRRNLPSYASSFIGREIEMEKIANMLSGDDCRLLTLVGPGGIGKTRLAMEAVRSMSFPGETWFVPLAPLRDAMFLPITIAETLKLQLVGQADLRSAIFNQLERREMLLLLDNYEHLLASGGADFVSELLKRAPGIKLCVTSRQRLNLIAEWVYPVSGLEVPPDEDADELESFGAARLFVQRARQSTYDLDLGPGTGAAVARICKLVAGMPLALELAATWAATLSPAEIAAEIQRNLDFLRAGAQDIPDSHRSIRAVFDSSWELLSEQERQVFSQLSVFRGGFARQAAQTISGASLPLLRTLVSKSLLEYEQARDRYQFHELLRQYGMEKLAENKNFEADIRNRHSAYYCQVLHELEGALKGSRQQAALGEIEADIENIHSAWRWALANGNFEKLALAMDALGYFYEWRGRFEDGETTFAALGTSIGAATKPEHILLARTLIWRSVFERAIGDIELAQTTLAQALERANENEPEKNNRIVTASGLLRRGQLLLGRQNEAAKVDFLSSLGAFRAAEKEWEIGQAQQGLGEALWRLGDFDAGRKELEASLAIRRSLNDLHGLAQVTLLLSSLTRYQGRGREALGYAQECLEMCQRLNNQLDIAVAMSNLAIVQGLIQGRFSEAYELQEQSMVISDRLNDLPQLCLGHARQAMLLRFLGDFEGAQKHTDRGLAIARDINHRHYLAFLLLRQGQALICTGENDEAQRFLSESLALYRQASVVDQELVALLSLTFTRRHIIGEDKVQKQLLNILATYLEKRYFYPIQDAIQFIMLTLLDGAISEEKTSPSPANRLAFELVGFLSQFPAMRAYFEHFPVFRLIDEAAAELPPAWVDSAKARGQKRDIWETGTELLEQLPELGWTKSAAQS